jgi:hypothetical protein
LRSRTLAGTGVAAAQTIKPSDPHHRAAAARRQRRCDLMPRILAQHLSSDCGGRS